MFLLFFLLFLSSSAVSDALSGAFRSFFACRFCNFCLHGLFRCKPVSASSESTSRSPCPHLTLLIFVSGKLSSISTELKTFQEVSQKKLRVTPDRLLASTYRLLGIFEPKMTRFPFFSFFPTLHASVTCVLEYYLRVAWKLRLPGCFFRTPAV